MGAVCIIPARGNSQRIPRKNLRMFHGQPIISFSIQTARESEVFDEVVVSTDDEEIADVARQYGADVLMRDPALAQNEVGTQEVMRAVLMGIPADFACCLYPTAPMLRAKTLVEAYDWLRNRQCNYIVPVGEWLVDPGLFYFGSASAFRFGRPLLGLGTMFLPVDPRTCCDINVEADWLKAEQMYAQLRSKA
jgi:pseudaminic acid cytidylyltransferase